MTQSFEPPSQNPQSAIPDPALKQLQTQTVLYEVKRRMQRGANNFYWIAALSAINSVILEFGGSAYFVVGLASTLFVDSFAVAVAKDVPEAAIIVKIVGLVISFIFAGIFALFGLFANRGKRWAFVVGMVLYSIDALLMLAFQEWMGLIFHGLFLFGLFGGLQALNQIQKALPAQPPQPRDSFPQNIGTS